MYDFAINRTKLELAIQKAKAANDGKEPTEEAVKAEYVKLAGAVREIPSEKKAGDQARNIAADEKPAKPKKRR